MKLHKVFLLCFIISAGEPGEAGELQVNRIGTGNGLSENVVHCIHQDMRGFIWFGTQGGLNRYDGHKFRIYNKSNSSISHNQILSIAEDKEQLWVGTGEGLNKFDPVRQSFTVYNNSNKNVLYGDNSINRIFVLNDSILVISTFSNVFFFNKITGKFIQVFLPNNTSLPLIFSSAVTKEGTVILGGAGGLYLYDSLKKTLTPGFGRYDFSEFVGIPVTSLIMRDDILFASTSDGYYELNLITRKRKFISLKGIASDDHVNIVGMVRDHDSNFWVISEAGLIKISSTKKNIISLQGENPVQKNSNYPRFTSILYDDANKKIWISTFGGGIYKINLKKKNFNGFAYAPENKDSLNINFIMNIYEDSRGNFWFSSIDKGFDIFSRDEGKFYHFPSRLNEFPFGHKLFFHAFPYSRGKTFIHQFGELSNYSVSEDFRMSLNYKVNTGINFSTLIVDKHGTFWGGDYWGIYKFRENFEQKSITDTQYFKINYPVNFILDDDSILWMGSNGQGLFKLNKNNSVIKNFLPSVQLNMVLQNTIYHIHKDREGNLWLATYGDGLLKFNSRVEVFENLFTVENGLADNTVYAILEDKNTNLWMSTNKGISCYKTIEKRFINFYKADGLINSEYNRKSCCIDKDGYMYFGGVDGVDFFDPYKILSKISSPKMYLTDFKLFDKSYKLDKDFSFTTEIYLAYDQNFFSFEFTSLDYTEGNEKFSYILEGVDQKWITSESDGIAKYTHISPGSYEFKVRDFSGSEASLSIKIIITPPYWETWYFKVAFASVTAALFIFLFLRHTKRLKQEKESQEVFSRNLMQSIEEERKRIAREMHDGIGQNLLIIKNKAFTAINTSEPCFSGDELSSIESLALSSLNELRDISYNLHPHQLERLGISKAVESIFSKVGNSVKINFNISIEDIDHLINKDLEINLFRIVQESVNNIIKHSGAKNASVIISRSKGCVLINIEDDGNGFKYDEKINSRSMGLMGINERVKILGGKVEINSAHGKGTSILIDIPVQYE